MKSATDAVTMAHVTPDMLEAKLQLVEAKTETKFAQVLGKLDLITSTLTALATKVDGFEGELKAVREQVGSSKLHIFGVTIATGLATAALIYAGVQLFQGGIGIGAGAFQAGYEANASRQPTGE